MLLTRALGMAQLGKRDWVLLSPALLPFLLANGLPVWFEPPDWPVAELDDEPVPLPPLPDWPCV